VLDDYLRREYGVATPIDIAVKPAAGREDAGRLAKIYIEATTRCNLACRTCVRNAWDEPMGDLPLAAFQELVAQLAWSRTDAQQPLTLVFAGYGEPFFHPDIMEMLRLAKGLGARVEVVTNGTLVDQACAKELVDLAIDRVWFSIDGLTPERYAAIRCGGQLATVRDHVQALHIARTRAWKPSPEIGLAFVAMRANIAELPELQRLAANVRASEILVSNLLPHTAEMVDETLYRHTLAMGRYHRSTEVPHVRLPRIDFDQVTNAALTAVLHSANSLALGGADLAAESNTCPFVRAGATALRWDGSVSPCPPLLHAHPVFVPDRWRRIKHVAFGNLAEASLPAIWDSAAYRAFRQKVWDFAFAPCVYCGGCDLAESNEEDCFGNAFPVCGSCLWAQGIVRCP
jgi:MoaA/NifB/PqqE/SkfB family radical SAM enzyme